MRKYVLLITSFCVILFTSNLAAQVDTNFHLYLLFGQSNMNGDCNRSNDSLESLDFQEEDCEINERVKVLAFKTCGDTLVSGPCRDLTLNREEGKWYTAFPPYHNCGEGVGPADYFGKVMLDSIKENISIGFIPCALGGQFIDVFVKGSDSLPKDWAHGEIEGHAYDWMVSRCKLAQQSGVIKGILFNHGENNSGEPSWVDKVKSIFDNLKKDLNLNSNIPIMVGELLQDTGACCTSHIPLVHKLASEYPNCGLVSTKGLKKKVYELWKPDTTSKYDEWGAHFNCAAYREMGRRFAFEFLKMTDRNYIPRKEYITSTVPEQAMPFSAVRNLSRKRSFKIYSLSGSFIGNFDSLASFDLWRDKLKGKTYIVYDKFTQNGKFLVIP